MKQGNKGNENWLDALFLDGGKGLFDKSDTAIKESIQVADRKLSTSNYPELPEVTQAPAEQLEAYWRTLRMFFRTGLGGGLPEKNNQPTCFPALLAPYRDSRNTAFYPTWLIPEQTNVRFEFLSSLLHKAWETLPSDQPAVKELRKHLPRLEQLIHKSLRETPQGASAPTCVQKAVQQLEEAIGLPEQDGNAFSKAGQQLQEALPQTGVLLPYSKDYPFYLLAELLRLEADRKQQLLKDRIAPLLSGIRRLLAVEKEKGPEAKSASSLEASMDFAGTFLKFDELAAILPETGSAPMPEDRLTRLQQLAETLGQAEHTMSTPTAFLVLSKSLVEGSDFPFRDLFLNTAVEVVPDQKVYVTTKERFDEKHKVYAETFAAIRIAELELNGQYLHEVHGDFFQHFDWTAYTSDEHFLCPSFLTLTSGSALLKNNLESFSALLATNRPIKSLVLKFDTLGHYHASDEQHRTTQIRQEPAALAIAHRDTYVLQTTLAEAPGLSTGFRDGLSSPTPTFFYILVPGKQFEPYSGLLWAGSALGSREFPSFIFDCQKGPKWGSRFDISANPGIDQDWSDEYLRYLEDKEEVEVRLPFTFADFAALDQDFKSLFQLVPQEYWTDNLIPISEYLQLPETEAYKQVPFVWMIDADNRLCKAAVASSLVNTCRERLDFWHYLQENAGIHSFHVETATNQLRTELQVEMAKTIDELKAKHKVEVEQAKTESAQHALTYLADYLLELNPEAMPQPVQKSDASQEAIVEPVKDTVENSQEETGKPEAKPEKEETPAATQQEAWIETDLCTTCNECIDLNNRMFKYNADKQAEIVDLSAGTYADLVKAAEQCPVSIIHPGTPLNADEPNLEALIKRASKFN